LLAQVAESTGNSDVALDALSRSARIISSAPRSRLVGDAAYRVGDLAQAEEAFSQAVKLSKGSMTGQASDLISLAQVYVDSGNADAALQVFTGVPRRYAEAPQFIAAQAAMQAQAYAKLGDLAQAKQAFSVAMEHAGETGDNNSNSATLGLARAAFAVGQDDYAAELIADAIKSDHENRFLVAQARRVLGDAGKEELIAELIDRPMNECLAVIAEANALMRGAQFEASLSKLEEALDNMPQNTGVLMAAAQIYLLWMSQKGVDREYVARVNGYLAKLEQLIPGNERVAKMHLFLQRILNK
jgi:tetratricopeptide (TPR) repeat protein